MIRRVLMIDDEADIRKIGLLSLKDVGGWAVSLAASGAEGVALAAKEAPDVILLDVMMPGLDGPSTLAALRANAATAQIPVIFMTAKAQKHEVSQYLEMGARAVIAKPFDPMALPSQIRRLLGAP